jgi:hypothetical protein
MNQMYFAANQQKQKAFDQYYNAMATSNFKQGRKLRALINQEADDAALTEKLASLYASSTAKSHEYDYDTVSKKLRGRVEKPAEGKTMKARTYVHESTDSQQMPTHTRRASVDEFLQDQGTKEFIRTTRAKPYWTDHYKHNNLPGAEKKAEATAKEYVENATKANRGKHVRKNRKMSQEDLSVVEDHIKKEILKRDIKDDIKKDVIKQEDDEEKISSEDHMERMKHMKHLMSKNKALRYDFDTIKNNYVDKGDWDRHGFYEDIQRKFAQAIDARTSLGHFERMDIKPKTPYATGERSFKDYVKKVKVSIDAILTV